MDDRPVAPDLVAFDVNARITGGAWTSVAPTAKGLHVLELEQSERMVADVITASRFENAKRFMARG